MAAVLIGVDDADDFRFGDAGCGSDGSRVVTCSPAAHDLGDVLDAEAVAVKLGQPRRYSRRAMHQGSRYCVLS